MERSQVFRFVCEKALGLKPQISFKKVFGRAMAESNLLAATECFVMEEYFKNENPVVFYSIDNPFYKKRLEKITNQKIELPESFVFSEPGSAAKVYSFNEGIGQIKAGQLPHRLLGLLLKNRFLYFTVEEIFERVFPERIYFNPNSSPNLIHQAVKRLNKLLLLEKVPLQLISENERYKLQANGPVNIIFSQKYNNLPAFLLLWKKTFNEQWVQVRTAADLMKLSPRKIQSELKTFAVDFEIKRKGREIFYRMNHLARYFTTSE